MVGRELVKPPQNQLSLVPHATLYARSCQLKANFTGQIKCAQYSFTAEATVALELNQGERKKWAVHPCLRDAIRQDFFLDFFSCPTVTGLAGLLFGDETKK